MKTRADNTQEYDVAVMKINSFLKRGLEINIPKIVSDLEIYLDISMLPDFKAELIETLDEALARALR